MGRLRLHTAEQMKEIRRAKCRVWYAARKADPVFKAKRAKAAKEYRNRKILAASAGPCLLLILSACSVSGAITGLVLNLHSTEHGGVCPTPIGIDVACNMGVE